MNKVFNYIRSSPKIHFSLFWLIVFAFTYIQALCISSKVAAWVALLISLNMLAVALVTSWILIPKLLAKGSKHMYALSSLVFIAALIYESAYTEMFIFKYFDVIQQSNMTISLAITKNSFMYILVFTVCNLIFFLRCIAEDRKQKEELVTEKKAMEIKMLRSQINSHFLFNALHNIYSMTYFKDKYTSGYVLKLSQMMRYVLEDCESELTPLNKEIEYINNFIDFQKLRYENDEDISFDYNNTDAISVSVPPMIFQPLVENCFKHCPLDVEENSYIHISMDVNYQQIRFVAENSQPLFKQKPQKTSNGIGIENIKRRLWIHYGDNYELNIQDVPDLYKVELCINLKLDNYGRREI